MSTLRILGYANSKAATIVVDRASPRSLVSAAFLFNNDLNSSFDSTGCDFARLTILVPSEGGYYSSSSLSLQSSTMCVADVVLGADWLALCRIKIGSSTLQRPAPESVVVLPEGHVWTADGTLHFDVRDGWIHLPSRSLLAVFAPTHP